MVSPTIMMNEKKEIKIVSAGYGHGQKKMGVEDGPDYILSEGLLGKLRPKVHVVCEDVPVGINKEQLMGIPYYLHRPLEVGVGTQRVYQAVKRGEVGEFTLVVGGDHSIAIGSVSAQLEKHKDELGLIWVDAHADINTLESTESGNIHGCPVSFLMGIQGMQIQSFNWLSESPQRHLLKPENIVYIGLRDVDPAEALIMKKLGITEFDMTRVRELGIREVMKRIMIKFDEKKVYLSFDIDALDPSIAPATGTAVPDGLTLEEGLTIVNEVSKLDFVGMDLVEVNPKLARNEEQLKKTIDAAHQVILEAFS